MEKEMFINAGEMTLPSSSPSKLNWVSMETQPLEQSIFDSALSSLVSPPTPSNSNFSGGDSFVFRELIGKLGNIGYDSREIYGSDSCYATPISSPPQRMVTKNSTPLAEFSGDPGFAERAAKFSCFGSQSFNGRTNSPFPFNNGTVSTVTSNGKLPRVWSSRSFNGRTNSPLPINNGHVATVASNGKLPRVSSTPALKVTDSQIPAGETSRKRKAKFKEIEEKEDYDSKRSKRSEENEEKTKEVDDPYKDFIHVRARRGQATDSHSLAERVRREKISERMKMLQDLVPGCNKVTGKALMLEEIINYVQSLQRQVEFLSMKLSSVNTRLDFNMDNTLTSKDMFSSSNNLMHQQALPLETNIMVPLETSETRSFVSHLPHFTDSISQYSTFSEDDLRSIIHGSNQCFK